MSLSRRSIIIRTLLLATSVAGCNTILDNKPGKLENVTPSVAPTQPALNDAGGAPEAPPVVVPTTPTEPVKEPTPVTPKGCETGSHQCGGTCAANNDPNYGCGAEACTACVIPHATAACAGTACAVGTCAKGYADCNNNPADGCETDLSKPATCGACNAVCPTESPLCAPVGASFQCGGGCPAAAPIRCGNECMLSLTTVNHCGTCDNKCPEVANAVAACSALGQCGFTCNPGFHACGGACIVDTDPAACGPACTPCPAAPYANAVCTANQCGIACVANQGNCNNDPADGCEAPLLGDPLNCGACGVSCNGGTCNNGQCSAPPDPDAGAPPPPPPPEP